MIHQFVYFSLLLKFQNFLFFDFNVFPQFSLVVFFSPFVLFCLNMHSSLFSKFCDILFHFPEFIKLTHICVIPCCLSVILCDQCSSIII